VYDQIIFIFTKTNKLSYQIAIPEHEAEAALSALTQEQWQKLFVLIPEIETTSDFGEVPCEDDEEGILTISSETDFAPVVWKFLDIVSEIPIIIDFGWMHWDEGRKVLFGNDNLNTCDIVFLCKLITIAVRADRFSNGTLLSVFESGRMLEILRVLEGKVEK